MAEPSLQQIFDSIDKFNVLIVGDVMLDSYIWGAVERISPEAPVPVVRVREKDFRLGGAGNVALNIHALGANPILCSVIGNDDDGKKLLRRLDEKKISSKGIVISTTRPTTVKTRVIASHQHVVRVDEESDAGLDASEQQDLLKRISELLPSCHVVVFEDYDKGVLNSAVIEKTVALANERGVPTVVDPKKRNFLSYHGVTLFKPNLKELREGLKVEVDVRQPGQLEKAVELLQSRLHARAVMVTLSEHGVYIQWGSEKITLPAHKREIADVSGAGDTVISIAAVCVAAQASPRQIAALSNLGGGLVCQHVGVVPVNKQEWMNEAVAEGI